VATVVVLLLHVPPAGVEFRLVVAPTHIFVDPVIAVGSVLTVTGKEIVHDPPAVYETVAVPADIPVTTPLVDPMLPQPEPHATDHVPPPVVELNVVDCPTHNWWLPVIGFGAGATLTVVVAVAVNPFPSVTVSV
jgi:hypothetical protein